MVPASPEKSWKVMEFEKSPGKSWNFADILEKFWKSPEIFLWSNSPKERSLSKHQHFSGFLCMLNLAVHWLTALIFIWGVLVAIMSIHRGQYRNFGRCGSSTKKCDDNCDQTLIKKQLGICIEYTYISESMLCLHRGKSVKVKWVKKSYFWFFQKRSLTWKNSLY